MSTVYIVYIVQSVDSTADVNTDCLYSTRQLWR